MSAEVTATGSLEFDNARDVDEALAKIGLRFDCSGTKCIKNVQSIGFAAEEAIVLGECTAPGWGLFINLDNTNFITLRVATGVTTGIELEAKGGFALLKLGSTTTAPFAIADTAACRLSYMIVNRS